MPRPVARTEDDLFVLNFADKPRIDAPLILDRVARSEQRPLTSAAYRSHHEHPMTATTT
jgi:hypothetical protein